MSDGVIMSSGKPVDRSWRLTFKPDLALRAAARIEYARVHAVVHAHANVMYGCPVCLERPTNSSLHSAGRPRDAVNREGD